MTYRARLAAVVGLVLCLLTAPAAVGATPGPLAESWDEAADWEQPAPWPPLPAVVHGALPTRLVIPKIGVNAPITDLGVTAEGVMESPWGPSQVGWYRFSPTPGQVGNAVFSGHRDWRTGVTAVFWRLGALVPGDSLEVRLADGRQIAYQVVFSMQVKPDTLPIEVIVGQTYDEMITLITCEGVFDATRHDYDLRRVVWASRVR